MRDRRWETRIEIGQRKATTNRPFIKISSRENADIYVEEWGSETCLIAFVASHIILISGKPIPLLVDGAYRERRFHIADEKLELFIEGERLIITRTRIEKHGKVPKDLFTTLVPLTALLWVLLSPSPQFTLPRSSRDSGVKITDITPPDASSREHGTLISDYLELRYALTIPEKIDPEILKRARRTLLLQSKLLEKTGNLEDAERFRAKAAALLASSRMR